MPDRRGLGIARESLVAISAAIATRDPVEVERALRIAARVADAAAVDEVLLQSHLFVGFPLAIEAILTWRLAVRRETVDDVADDPAEWAVRGPRVCRTVYGRNYEKLRANVAALHPDLDRWMVEGGYGRVLGRPQLDLATRELCIVALLAVWDSPRQLHSHLRGALNAGAPDSHVDAAVQVACRYLSAERSAAVRALWSKVRPAPEPTPGAV